MEQAAGAALLGRVLTPHPATFTPSVLSVIREVLESEIRLRGPLNVLDPFAGTGAIHSLRHAELRTWGVEIEPEWAAAASATFLGDATAIDIKAHSFDAVVTSPAYGNRMADSYDGRDGSVRRTYRLSLGRELSVRNGAGMHWHVGSRGDGYRTLHERAIAEMIRVVKPGGLIAINMKNHIRAGMEQLVVEWWIEQLLATRSRMVEVIRVRTPNYGFGANSDLRVDGEVLIVVRTPPAPFGDPNGST